MQPKLWAKAPTAILSLYGPTNLHQAKGLTDGPRSDFPLPDFTPEFLGSITHYDNPPTNISLFASKGFNQRLLLGMKVIREGILAEFILKGLRQDSKLALPESGIVSKEAIDSISKFI